jgi:hypothetical protein
LPWEEEQELQKANAMTSLAGTLELVWHIEGWGLAIVLGTLLAWELVASRQRAKADQNFQDWSSKSHKKEFGYG